MLVTKKKVQPGYSLEQRLPEKGRFKTEGKKRHVDEVPNREAVRRNSLTLCGLLLCLLLVSVGLISQYSQVVAVKLQIHQVQKEIEELQSEIEHLHIEVHRLSSLERIEMIAKNDLGLQYPEKRQWLRIARGE